MKPSSAFTFAIAAATTLACVVGGAGCGTFADFDSGPAGGHSALYESGTGTVLPVNGPRDGTDTIGDSPRVAAETGPVPPARPETDSDGQYAHRVENSDASITAAIRQRIVNAKLSPRAQDVDVSTDAARVTLRGTVDSMAEKETIARLARQVAGATRVDDRVEVVMAR